MGREEAENILTDAGAAADGEFPLLDAAIACAIHEDPAATRNWPATSAPPAWSAWPSG